MSQSPVIRIIHLSNLQFKESPQNQQDRIRVHKGLNNLVEGLGYQKPDVVVITGDLAFSGKEAEYNQARIWLDSFMKACGLNRDRLLLVPGNHDVDRGNEQIVRESLIETILSGKKKLGEILENEGARRGLLSGHQAYLKFERDCTGSDFTRPYWSRRMEIKGVHLGFAGLCSSLLSFQNNEQSGLMLGRDQLNEVLNALTDSDFRIALIHHPGAYLTEQEQGQSWSRLRQECDLILHGHLHEQGVSAVRENNDECLELAAGCLYESSTFPNSFQLLAYETAKAEMAITPYIWKDRGWIHDKNAFDNKPGIGRFPLTRKSPATAAIRSLPDVAFLEEYRAAFAHHREHWDFSIGGVYARESKPSHPPLEEMYQPLRLCKENDTNELGNDEVLPPERVLSLKKSLIIRGVAGSGKTTWMRRVFLHLLRRGGCFPVPLELRDLAASWKKTTREFRNPMCYLIKYIQNFVPSVTEAVLDRLFATEGGPRPILLVDGWDELGHFGEDFRGRLLALQKKYPALLVIATSRPYGEGRPSHADGYDVWEIQPLNDREVEAFAERFHRLCFARDKKSFEELRTRFEQALAHSEGARDLSRTPLLLTMMLFISRTRLLPDKRHELYEACVQHLLVDQPNIKDEEQGPLFRFYHWMPEDGDQRWQVLTELAWGLQERGVQERGDRDGSITVVAERARFRQLLPDKWTGKQRSGFINWLIDRAGLLVDREDETLAFTHLSFQEYLCARYLTNKYEGDAARIGLIKRLGHKEPWWDTLRLWAALLNRSTPERVDHLAEWVRQKEDPPLIWLIGAFFADGLGSDSCFTDWAETALKMVAAGYDEHQKSGTRFWVARRESTRWKMLCDQAVQLLDHIDWLAQFRLVDWLDDAGLPPSSLKGRLKGRAARVLNCFWACVGEPETLLTRGLTSSYGAWPGKPLEQVLLRCWPGQRARVGMRLQALLMCGISPNDLLTQKGLLGQVPQSGEDRTDLARDLAHVIAKESEGYFVGFMEKELNNDFARDFVRDLSWELARDLHGYFKPAFAKTFAREYFRYFSRIFSTFFVKDFEGYMARDFAKYFARFFARTFPRLVESEREGVARWLRERGLPQDKWTETFAWTEIFGVGRMGPRVFLAHKDNLSNPLIKLFSQASRQSLDSKKPDKLKRLVDKLPKEVDPLWPALARHIARCSTDADKRLLEDLARHPEKRNGELCRSLQYMVRGDLLFADGGSLSLDELCDQHGLPHFPYLEAMPDELTVEWEH